MTAHPAVDERASLPIVIEAEQSVLGAILVNDDALTMVSGFLEARHFGEALHARIYSSMLELAAAGRRATLIALGAQLDLDDFKMPEGAPPVRAYLARLAVEATTIVNTRDYAEMIVDSWRRREVIRIAQDAQEAARAPVATPVKIVSDMLDAVGEVVADARVCTRRAIDESAEDLLEYGRKIRVGEIQSKCVTTGFADVDAITGGYEAGTLWVVGARPGQGKTIWQVTSSLKVATAGARAGRDGKQAFGVLCFSHEVPEKQITARYLSDLSFSPRTIIEFSRIARGDYDDREAWALADAAKRLRGLPLTIDVASRSTLAEIGAKVRAEKKRMTKAGVRLSVVFIDYLKYVKASDRYKGQRHYEVGEISAGLHELAKDEDVCIVLLAQLNRQLEGREDKRPNTADLRESGDLEADADVVAFIHREAQHILKSPDYRKGRDEAVLAYESVKHDAELIIGKNRAGPERTAHLWCHAACSTMANGANSDGGRL